MFSAKKFSSIDPWLDIRLIESQVHTFQTAKPEVERVDAWKQEQQKKLFGVNSSWTVYWIS